MLKCATAKDWLHTVMNSNAGAMSFNAKVCYYAGHLSYVLVYGGKTGSH